MQFPLEFHDLSLWLAITAIILLITLEILSPSYGRTNIYINNHRLEKAAIAVSTVFLITLAIRIINLILYP